MIFLTAILEYTENRKKFLVIIEIVLTSVNIRFILRKHRIIQSKNNFSGKRAKKLFLFHLCAVFP